MVHKIDTPGSVSGTFSSGNPFAGISATEVGAAWLNSNQAEQVALVEAAGLTPSKTDNTQILQAVQILAGSGLTAAGVARLNGSRAGGSPIAGEFRRLLEAVRAVQSSATSGFRLPTLLAQTFGETLAGFTLPAGYFAHGGEMRVSILGRVKPASSNTTVSIAIRHNGELFRSSGAFGSQGYLVSNATAGTYRLLKLANSTRDDAPATSELPFSLELTISSLGQFAQRPGAWIGPGTDDRGPGNTIARGAMRFGWYTGGKGRNPFAMTTEGGFWTSGAAYLKDGDLVWRHGVVYTPTAAHTADSTNEPGAGADWRAYWTLAELVLEIDHGNQVDWSTEQEITIDVGSGKVDDTDDPAAWSPAAVSYSVGNRVLNGGFNYVCVEAHSSNVNREPGDSTGAGDGERYWERYGANSADLIHIDRIAAYALGGTEGLTATI